NHDVAPSDVKRQIAALRRRAAPSALLDAWRARSHPPFRHFYDVAEQDAVWQAQLSCCRKEATLGNVNCDSLSDLLAYRAPRAGESRQRFMSPSIARSEAGQHVYTAMHDGKLAAAAWLIERPTPDDVSVHAPGAA